jgi:hypothetical protein
MGVGVGLRRVKQDECSYRLFSRIHNYQSTILFDQGLSEPKIEWLTTCR